MSSAATDRYRSSLLDASYALTRAATTAVAPALVPALEAARDAVVQIGSHLKKKEQAKNEKLFDQIEALIVRVKSEAREERVPTEEWMQRFQRVYGSVCAHANATERMDMVAVFSTALSTPHRAKTLREDIMALHSTMAFTDLPVS